MLSASFTAPYDGATKIISALSGLILLSAGTATHNLLVTALALALLFVVFAYSPRGYDIAEGSLVIRRMAGSVRLPLLELREARQATKDDFRGCVRVWGNGGLFGYTGTFRTATLGKSTWYLGDRSRAVVLRFGGKTVLVSPGDVEGFLEAMRPYVPRQAAAPGVPAEIAGGGSAGPARALVLGAAVLLGLAGTVVAFFAVSYTPGPPDYTLTRDSLIIHDRFYPVTLQADAVDVAHVQVVDVTDGSDWRPTQRTNGFANSHYQSGWFRTSSGQKIRLYRAGGDRLVLIPPKGSGNAVLLEARDEQRLVDEIQRQWQVRP